MRRQWIILLGGCCLAFGAAFANAGLLLQTGTSVSHLTGDISRLSINLVTRSPEVMAELLRVGAATLAFLGGAFFSGFVIHRPTFDFARPYGRAVTGIGALFLVSHLLVSRTPTMAISLAAFGCGVQNSLASSFRGIVLRTTHLTGLLTDFGVNLGMRARGFRVPLWKIAVPGLLTGAFICGGGAAAAVDLIADGDPALVAGIAYLVAGLLWTVAKHRLFRNFFAGLVETDPQP
ncbi:MAG TPA: YoaK family protein [Bacteroidia bacterium]|nr:YoaK family protein [Bacteroidia bacterium]